MANNKRIIYLDNLKGFLIILVILGHVIQFMYSPTGFDYNPIFRFIYSFHMPLFILISGFVANSHVSDRDTLFLKVKKRALQLVVPFIIWRLIHCILYKSYDLFIIFKHPDYGLWFLWILFILNTAHWTLSFVISRFINNNILKEITTIITIEILFIISSHCISYMGGVTIFLEQYYPYFALGCLLKHAKSRLSKRTKLLAMVTSFLVFIPTTIYWYRISCFVPSGSPLFVYFLNHSIYTHMISGVSGCIFFMTLFSFLSQKISLKALSYIGTISLPLYVSHQEIIHLIVKYSNNDFIILYQTRLGLIVCFVIVFFLTYILYRLSNTNKITAMLFFGKKI